MSENVAETMHSAIHPDQPKQPQSTHQPIPPDQSDRADRADQLKQHVHSASPYEAQFGFSRALRVENRIIVSGTGPIEDDGTTTRGNAAAQAERCCKLIVQAIEELGGSATDLVRSRMFLTDITQQQAVGAVHARYFGAARPAATMVGVAALCRPEWLVEIEAEAVILDK